MNLLYALPKTGWTYCPKCDKDTMLAMDEKHYNCTGCGLAILVASSQGQPLTIEWSEPLELTEMVRYQSYLMQVAGKANQEAQAAAQAEAEKRHMEHAPWRVRLAFKLANLVCWPLKCRVGVMHDKTDDLKGGAQTEQTQGQGTGGA